MEVPVAVVSRSPPEDAEKVLDEVCRNTFRGSYGVYVYWQGMTLMHVAAMRSARVDTLKHLISAGFPIDQKNAFGTTPLMTAIENGNDVGAIVLIEAGADTNATDDFGRTAFERAPQLPWTELFLQPIRNAVAGPTKSDHDVPRLASAEGARGIKTTFSCSFWLDIILWCIAVATLLLAHFDSPGWVLISCFCLVIYVANAPYGADAVSAEIAFADYMRFMENRPDVVYKIQDQYGSGNGVRYRDVILKTIPYKSFINYRDDFPFFPDKSCYMSFDHSISVSCDLQQMYSEFNAANPIRNGDTRYHYAVKDVKSVACSRFESNLSYSNVRLVYWPGTKPPPNWMYVVARLILGPAHVLFTPAKTTLTITKTVT